MREFYIKTVMVILKSERTICRFVQLIGSLSQKGISVQIHMMGMECPICSQDTLYITDSNQVAAMLRKSGLPMLGFAHGEGDTLEGTEYIMEQPEELEAEYLEGVYRRCQKIPWDILETERCYIRESMVEDVTDFFAIYASPDITRYTEDLFPEVEQEKAYIRQYIDTMYRYYEFGVWTVLSKETGEIIGRAGFDVREGYDLPELGFVIGSKWQRQGIAYEICKAILKYGWETYEFEAVNAFVMPQNNASLILCNKLGFVPGETIREKNREYVKLTIEKPLS